MWSLDGAGLTFPPSVSLPVGGNSTIQHLVLQVLLLLVVLIMRLVLVVLLMNLVLVVLLMLVVMPVEGPLLLMLGWWRQWWWGWSWVDGTAGSLHLDWPDPAIRGHQRGDGGVPGGWCRSTRWVVQEHQVGGAGAPGG